MREYITNLARKGLRVDGRGLDDIRPVKVIKGVAGKAEGSALAFIGNTRVLAGVKLEAGKSFPDNPDEGALIVNSESIPLASPNFESGPPKPGVVELARVVDRGIRESKAIDMKKLCITKGEAVWVVFVDTYSWNYDGNLTDTSALAAIGALQDAKMPKYEDNKVVYEKTKNPLPLVKTPVAVTFAKIGEAIMVDPCASEEEVAKAKLTVTTSNEEINALQKSGRGGFTQKEVSDMIENAFKRRRVFIKALEGGKD